jgi:hypothetical protein
MGMQRLKILVLACWAALALSAVTTASASATCQKKPGTKKYALCVEGTLTSSAAIELQKKPQSSSEVMQLTYTVEPRTGINCETLTSIGELTGSTAVVLKEHLKLSECELTGPLTGKCRFPKEKSFQETTGEFVGSAENVAVKAAGPPSQWLTKVALQQIANCPNVDIGEYALAGKYECKLLEPEVEKVQHVETCEGEHALTFSLNSYLPKIKYDAVMSLTGSNKGHTFSIYEH